MGLVYLITALACVALILGAALAMRRPGPRCWCGADASIIMDHAWYCAQHASERLERLETELR